MLEDINDDVVEATPAVIGKVVDERCYDALSSSFAGCDHLMDKVAKLSAPGNSYSYKILVVPHTRVIILCFT